MAFEQRDNSGALFKNDRQENDRQPGYRGDCKIDGRDYWISAWLKEDRNGNKFFSLSFEDKEKGRQEGAAKAKDFTGDRSGDAPDARDDPRMGMGGSDPEDTIPF